MIIDPAFAYLFNIVASHTSTFDSFMIKLNFAEKLAYNFLEGEPMAVLPAMALEALGDGIGFITCSRIPDRFSAAQGWKSNPPGHRTTRYIPGCPAP